MQRRKKENDRSCKNFTITILYPHYHLGTHLTSRVFGIGAPPLLPKVFSYISVFRSVNPPRIFDDPWCCYISGISHPFEKNKKKKNDTLISFYYIYIYIFPPFSTVASRLVTLFISIQLGNTDLFYLEKSNPLFIRPFFISSDWFNQKFYNFSVESQMISWTKNLFKTKYPADDENKKKIFLIYAHTLAAWSI